MTILGIDPGTATTGWGVIKVVKNTPNYIASGTISTDKKHTDEERLHTIYKDLGALLTTYKPEALALENLFFNTNSKTALTVGQALGVIMLVAVTSEIPIYSYTPLQVKMAMTGYGRADKKQIQEMVKNILKLPQVPRPDDAADALAVALTHAFTLKIRINAREITV